MDTLVAKDERVKCLEQQLATAIGIITNVSQSMSILRTEVRASRADSDKLQSLAADILSIRATIGKYQWRPNVLHETPSLRDTSHSDISPPPTNTNSDMSSIPTSQVQQSSSAAPSSRGDVASNAVIAEMMAPESKHDTDPNADAHQHSSASATHPMTPQEATHASPTEVHKQMQQGGAPASTPLTSSSSGGYNQPNGDTRHHPNDPSSRVGNTSTPGVDRRSREHRTRDRYDADMTRRATPSEVSFCTSLSTLFTL